MNNSDNKMLTKERTPIWRDALVIKWVTQIGLLGLVLSAMFFLASEAGENLRARNIATGFDFLSSPPDFQLSEGIDTHPATGGRALWVGMVNTLRIAGAGIFFATVLGLVIGLCRLSSNWLIAKIGSIWVETLRNIPLLVQIIFYFAVLATLPKVTMSSGPIHGWIHITNKGVSIPRVFISDGFYQWFTVVLFGLLAAKIIYNRQLRKHEQTGQTGYPLLWASFTVAFFALLGLIVHPIFGFLGPVMGWIANIFNTLPILLPQILLSGLALFIAINWVRKFANNRRAATGHLTLTDDDWFRMIFAVVVALLITTTAATWTGLSSWILNSGRDLFQVLENKFDVNGAARPIDAMKPDIVQPGRFPNYGDNGLTMSTGFAAVFFGVAFYTSAFIAEIVRGGILAVPKGQIEAASAVGLRRRQALRLIIIPQAFRIILPPLGNQYLNLTKNTSLAIAVGYSDLVQVGQTTYNQTGKTLPVVAIWMLFYLTCSLTTSAIVNFFNIRMKLVEH